MLNIGYGNIVPLNRIIAIVSSDSAPIKRMIHEGQKSGKLVDATYGRKTRSVVITDSGHIVLSAFTADSLAKRADGSYSDAAKKSDE
ncbi:MAG: DUF370 domain-containing protein [Candidatus Sericytochromatia bacterium]